MKPEDTCIVVAGNPKDGFSYYGPFENGLRASDWADHYFRNSGDWWVIGVEIPEENYDVEYIRSDLRLSEFTVTLIKQRFEDKYYDDCKDLLKIILDELGVIP